MFQGGKEDSRWGACYFLRQDARLPGLSPGMKRTKAGGGPRRSTRGGGGGGDDVLNSSPPPLKPPCLHSDRSGSRQLQEAPISR